MDLYSSEKRRKNMTMKHVGHAQLIDACKSIMTNAVGGHADVARVYAKALLTRPVPLDPSDRSLYISTQCTYMLSNLAHWRGEEAQRVKLILKAWMGV